MAHLFTFFPQPGKGCPVLAFFARAGGNYACTMSASCPAACIALGSFNLMPREPLMQAFVVPALRKRREGRGTRSVNTAYENKGWATRQHSNPAKKCSSNNVENKETP